MSPRLVLAIALGLAAATVQAGSWKVTEPRTAIAFNTALMKDIGLNVVDVRQGKARFNAHELAMRPSRPLTFAGLDDKRLAADIQLHVFEHLLGPGITHRGGFDLNWKQGSLSLRDFVLASAYTPREFELRTRDGFVAFRADFAHFIVDADKGRLSLFNLDLRMSRDLAQRLGHPEFEGMVVGTLELDARVAVPPGEKVLGMPPSCTDWSGDKDVALVSIGSVGQRDRSGGRVAISPSATLENVGTGNVPWHSKFSGNFAPYDNDQHPYLVWGIYRAVGGRFEQIGVSDVKHAFLTTNTGCDLGACTGSGTPTGNGHILGLGCRDTYGESNNNSNNALSFRSEITSNTGIWARPFSHFDQDGDNIQDHCSFSTDPGCTGDGFPAHRATVLESELTTPGATYYLDAWYVVRDDINIFNTMGWRQISPSFSGGTWTFGSTASFPYHNEPLLNAWVNEANPPVGTSHRVLTLPDGHLRLAARTFPVAGGTRYEYALQNHDFDRQVGVFSIPTGGATITDISFRGADGSSWTTSTSGNAVTWTKPGAQGQEWGTVYSFGFTADTIPSNSSALLTPVEGSTAPLAIDTLAPGVPGHVFGDDFE